MELVVYIAVLGVLARVLTMVGAVYSRASPSGFLTGLFTAPTLGWPVGVQEEDRDRVWNWDPPDSDVVAPSARVAAVDGRIGADRDLVAESTADFVPAGAIEDIDVARIPVYRVR